MSSKLNLFFAEGDDDHVVEYGFKFNGDFIMIEKFDNNREHLQEPLEIPSVDWEVQITIKKEDLTINQIEDHKNLLDEGKKVDITETILKYFNEQTKQDMKDFYSNYRSFRQIQKSENVCFISNDFEDYIQLYGINYTKELFHNNRHYRYKDAYMIKAFEN